jgi:hypothetical protein
MNRPRILLLTSSNSATVFHTSSLTRNPTPPPFTEAFSPATPTQMLPFIKSQVNQAPLYYIHVNARHLTCCSCVCVCASSGWVEAH